MGQEYVPHSHSRQASLEVLQRPRFFRLLGPYCRRVEIEVKDHGLGGAKTDGLVLGRGVEAILDLVKPPQLFENLRFHRH